MGVRGLRGSRSKGLQEVKGLDGFEGLEKPHSSGSSGGIWGSRALRRSRAYGLRWNIVLAGLMTCTSEWLLASVASEICFQPKAN